jgi:hypothetical protein
MSFLDKPAYRAGLRTPPTTSTNIFGLDYRKGVADREFKQRNPLFPKKSGGF